MAGCRPVTASSRRPRRRATSRGRRPACAGWRTPAGPPSWRCSTRARTTSTCARLTPAPPTPAAAERLGRGLAATHAAGAAAHGCGPPGWQGDGWLGPLSEPLPLALGAWHSWGAFYAQARIRALLPLARERGVLDAVRGRRARPARRPASPQGTYDTGEPASRLHGDLWSGNVLWTADEAVLIDPAAHGGHREADLAMLALFGAPHLERVLAAYDEAAPLADGWRDRVLLHQVHPLLLHAVLFGGSYAAQTLRAARRYV